MNKEELHNYCKDASNEIIRQDEEIRKLEKKNKQSTNNWNKLREYISTEWYSYDNDSVEFEVAKDILNKMQELEQGSDEQNGK